MFVAAYFHGYLGSGCDPHRIGLHVSMQGSSRLTSCKTEMASIPKQAGCICEPRLVTTFSRRPAWAARTVLCLGAVGIAFATSGWRALNLAFGGCCGSSPNSASPLGEGRFSSDEWGLDSLCQRHSSMWERYGMVRTNRAWAGLFNTLMLGCALFMADHFAFPLSRACPCPLKLPGSAAWALPGLLPRSAWGVAQLRARPADGYMCCNVLFDYIHACIIIHDRRT